MTSKTKKILEIPVDKTGQMLRRHYTYFGPTQGVSYVPAQEFEDIIKFDQIGSTQSSNYAIFKSKTSNKEYYMFMKEFEHMIKTQVLKLGMISGKFNFVKRGQSYGIKIISVSRLEIMV